MITVREIFDKLHLAHNDKIRSAYGKLIAMRVRNRGWNIYRVKEGDYECNAYDDNHEGWIRQVLLSTPQELADGKCGMIISGAIKRGDHLLN